MAGPVDYNNRVIASPQGCNMHAIENAVYAAYQRTWPDPNCKPKILFDRQDADGCWHIRTVVACNGWNQVTCYNVSPQLHVFRE